MIDRILFVCPFHYPKLFLLSPKPFWEMLQAEYILDLQKQLTLISSEARRESNGNLTLEGSIPSMTSVDKVCSELTFMHQ
jgi:hypothetical protein